MKKALFWSVLLGLILHSCTKKEEEIAPERHWKLTVENETNRDIILRYYDIFTKDSVYVSLKQKETYTKDYKDLISESSNSKSYITFVYNYRILGFEWRQRSYKDVYFNKTNTLTLN